MQRNNKFNHIVCLLISFYIIAFLPCTSGASTAKKEYLNADAAYQKLRKHHKIRKYRHNWLACIKKYQNVYKHDASDPWAAAGLYKSGVLYSELFKYSNNPSDREKALEIFYQVISHYPQSLYLKKSKKQIEKMTHREPVKNTLKEDEKKSPAKISVPTINKPKKTAKPKAPLPGIKRIVVDPGHGGRDYGAPGYYRGVHEKNLVLKIAKKLTTHINQRILCEVLLTRHDDTFLTLSERTEFANNNAADLFISIHTNASEDKRAYGTETYILNYTTDQDAILLAARENNTSPEKVSDLQLILSSLMQNEKINESSQVAGNVQESIYKQMKKEYTRIKNKGIKQAPFFVLLGAQMPSILIEIGFISNSRECKRLTNSEYQDKFCEAIVNGIIKYSKEHH